MIGLDPEECGRPDFAAVFSGNAPVPQGVRPYAQNYGGHQFGMVPLSGARRLFLLCDTNPSCGLKARVYPLKSMPKTKRP